MREMRAINFVNRLVERSFDRVGGRKMSGLGVSSKPIVGREFLKWLFELGRQRADAFLSEHFDRIGKESSTSIEQRFL
jgi:NTE family protein